MDPNELKRVLEELRHERNQRIGNVARWLAVTVAFFPLVALIVSSEVSGFSDNVHTLFNHSAIVPVIVSAVIVAAAFLLFVANHKRG